MAQRFSPAMVHLQRPELSQHALPAHAAITTGTEQWVDQSFGIPVRLVKQSSQLGLRADPPHVTLIERLKPPCVGSGWLRRYSRADLLGDTVAGLTVSVVLVPQAIAYALLADLSPVYGLYTSFAPLLVFAAVTSSRHTSIGPFALMSIVTSVLARDVLGREHDHDPHLHLETVLCITVIAGALQIVMGLLGAGVVASFLSDSAVAGFTTAAALIIASSQLSHTLGKPIPRGNFASTLASGAQLVLRGEANAYCGLMTASALAFMLGVKAAGRRWCARVPLFEQLVAVVVFTALAELYALPIPRVGDNGPLPQGLPPFRVPQPPADLDQGLALLQAGATAAGVSYLLSMSIVRTFALKHHYATDASRELLALGLANLVGGFCGAYPSSGSLSRSALCSSVGGRTPMHGVIQAAVVAVVLLGCTPLFAPMPLSVLAAIIYAALLSLIDAELPLRLLRTSPSDFAMWAAAFFGTVLFGVQPGIALAIGSSLSLLVARASRPQCEVLGRLPGTDLFRNASVYPCCQHSFQHVLVFRFGAPLHFANCEFFCARLRKLWRRRLARGEPLSHVLIDCSAIGDIDHSANSALNGLADELRAAHVALLLGCASQTLRDRLAVFGTLGGADALICESNVFVSLSAAVDLGCNSEAAGGGRAAAAAASQPLPRAQSRAAALDKASRAAEFALELAERGHGSSACDGLGAADELDTARLRTPSAKPSPQQPTLFQHFTPSVERQRSLGARGFALLRPRSAARLADADDNSFTRPAYGRLASTRVSANLSAGDDSDNNGFDSADERDACPTQEGDLQTLPPGAPGYRFDSARRS